MEVIEKENTSGDSGLKDNSYFRIIFEKVEDEYKRALEENERLKKR
jgi:hypothetical protein